MREREEREREERELTRNFSNGNQIKKKSLEASHKEGKTKAQNSFRLTYHNHTEQVSFRGTETKFLREQDSEMLYKQLRLLSVVSSNQQFVEPEKDEDDSRPQTQIG